MDPTGLSKCHMRHDDRRAHPKKTHSSVAGLRTATSTRDGPHMGGGAARADKHMRAPGPTRTLGHLPPRDRRARRGHRACVCRSWCGTCALPWLAIRTGGGTTRAPHFNWRARSGLGKTREHVRSQSAGSGKREGVGRVGRGRWGQVCACVGAFFSARRGALCGGVAARDWYWLAYIASNDEPGGLLDCL